MKQTHTHSKWYAGIVAQARTQTEALMSAFKAMPPPKTPQEVERTGKAILAVVKLADFADRLSGGQSGEESAEAGAPEPERPLNRHERRRLEALGKAVPRPSVQTPPTSVTIPTKASG